MGDERASQSGEEEAPEVLAFRAEVARVRDTVIPALREKQDRIAQALGGRRRRRSNPFASTLLMAAPSSSRK